MEKRSRIPTSNDPYDSHHTDCTSPDEYSAIAETNTNQIAIKPVSAKYESDGNDEYDDKTSCRYKHFCCHRTFSNKKYENQHETSCKFREESNITNSDMELVHTPSKLLIT